MMENLADSIVESYEPDRTKVMVEYELDESEVGENCGSGGEKSRGEGVNANFEVLMGAYRNDFRDNARNVLFAIADEPEIDTKRLMQLLGISENSVWRAIRAMKAVGLLVRECGDKGGRWIVKK